MRNSIKKMILTTVAVTVMVAGLAAPAMAEEQQPPQQQTVAPAPTVAAPNDEEPLKDPGIRQCDITPTACPDADGPLAEHGDNPGADTDADDPSPDHEEEEPLKDPGIRQCDITPTACPDAEDSSDDHGHTSDAGPDADEANPVEEEQEESKEAVSAPDEAGQIANSNPDIQGGCPFDYYYDEDIDKCLPDTKDFDFFPMLSGQKPWPDTAGGYVTLPGEFGGDLLIGIGAGISIVGGIVEKSLEWLGEGDGPIAWGFEHLAPIVGFATEVTGTIVSGAGELVGGVSDAVGDAVDAVGDAAEDAWDTVSGWF